ncbi:MAG: exo-alpha-sialidase [Nitrospirae bacterium]|nr:exo-alpha-sialidase [Nitrospirota bacterium]
MIRKTVIPHMDNTYSSFPTIVEHRDKLYVYYRQGRPDRRQCHGLFGKVRCFEIEKDVFLKCFDEGDTHPLLAYGKDYAVFESVNEIDSIVARLDDNLFVLLTRTYVKDETGRACVSYSETPSFANRHEVMLKEVEWLVFYGKPFKWSKGFIFTAYGVLKGQSQTCPLVLYTEQFHSWSLFCRVAGPEDDEQGQNVIFNECTIVDDGIRHTMFIRQDSSPYGIWYATSGDLCNWTPPKKLFSPAHAPCATARDGSVYLSFRNLIGDDVSAISLIRPFKEQRPTEIERYSGNPFDGGYSDLVFIKDVLYVIYYRGNPRGEPDIVIARMPGY